MSDMRSKFPAELVFIPGKTSRKPDRVTLARGQLTHGPKKDAALSFGRRLRGFPCVGSKLERVFTLPIWLDFPARQELASEVESSLDHIEFVW